MPGAIHVILRGGKNDGRATTLQALEIGVQGARIVVQILAGTELARIDEDRHHHRLALAHGRRAPGSDDLRAGPPSSALSRCVDPLVVAAPAPLPIRPAYGLIEGLRFGFSARRPYLLPTHENTRPPTTAPAEHISQSQNAVLAG